MIFPGLSMDTSLTRFPQYYEQAIASQIGQRVKRFYTETSKQVYDIHEEARHINLAEKKSHEETNVPGAENSLDSSGKETVAV